MDFEPSSEQTMLVDTVRQFVETELYPHEDLVERLDAVPPELQRQIQAKAIEVGLYAAMSSRACARSAIGRSSGGVRSGSGVDIGLATRRLPRAAILLPRDVRATSVATQEPAPSPCASPLVPPSRTRSCRSWPSRSARAVRRRRGAPRRSRSSIVSRTSVAAPSDG